MSGINQDEQSATTSVSNAKRAAPLLAAISLLNVSLGIVMSTAPANADSTPQSSTLKKTVNLKKEGQTVVPPVQSNMLKAWTGAGSGAGPSNQLKSANSIKSSNQGKISGQKQISTQSKQLNQ